MTITIAELANTIRADDARMEDFRGNYWWQDEIAEDAIWRSCRRLGRRVPIAGIRFGVHRDDASTRRKTPSITLCTQGVSLPQICCALFGPLP